VKPGKVCRLLRAALVALVASPMPATAQTAACAAASTQAELNDCSAQRYREADARLNQVYSQLRARLRDPRQRSLLEEAERAWIAYRDRECAFETSGTVGGSLHPMMQATCLYEKTTIRLAELTRQRNCKEADPSCVH